MENALKYTCLENDHLVPIGSLSSPAVLILNHFEAIKSPNNNYKAINWNKYLKYVLTSDAVPSAESPVIPGLSL